MIKQKTSRRTFVKTSATSALAFNFLPHAAKGANSRINVGCIGIGGKGFADTNGTADAGGHIVALCDVSNPKNTELERRKGQKKQITGRFPGAKFYEDYREMIAKEDIDAVTVSTPDHTHFHATMIALQKGLHVYCQKPLTHSIWEARQMTELAASKGVKTQMGNQAHAGEPIRRGVELIRAGIIGKVQEVHTWTNRPIWPQGHTQRPKSQPVPKGLNWDLWLGPAPYVEYSKEYQPFSWRGWWDWGTGALGDMACHIMDMPYWALDLSSPTSVAAQQKGNTSLSGPNASKITYQFPGTKYTDGALKFVWYDGDMRPEDAMWAGDFPTADHVFRRFDMMLIGEYGKMYFGRSRSDWVIKSAPGAPEFEEPEKTIPRVSGGTNKGLASGGPYQEWIDAIKNDGVALSHFAHSGPFTETVLLGNLAVRLGKKIKWDGKNLAATNAPEAAALIRRAYRKGWEI